ncbi:MULTISPECIES: hypothetical protein [unclassified Serratia (in: enterobacteria)]|uniref:glycine-rich domain-containing protein n=1 Tax=unclassified Serratia (in: enterobacteria) TaxID=2647522 RepID=UPI000502D7EB|nr:MULTISPECIES: hypothetical protein [unclassified Serratia (in: enterobacteria)]KFK95010.1 hypothetical protein IV04_21420 [Serratia sp. Ag1]KFK96699.1 hypothetical protein JV45_02955 [Serratia sp. Ag2]
MHRIDTPTALRDKFGTGKNGFTRGNPQTGVQATQLDDDYCDSLQEEICNVIESAGIALDKTKRNQLSDAITKLGTGRLVNIKTFTASGTYTPSTGVKKIRVKVWGGGGAGGGTQAVSTTQAAVGGGGTAGAYAESFITVSGALSVTVGAGGVSSVADGTNGGASSVGTLTAPGGVGGALGVANSSFPFGAQPRNPTVGTTGNVINTPGATASAGFTWSANGAIRSMGGQSAVGASQYAANSVGYAAGGSGAIAAGGAGAVAALSGFNGAPGLVIIEEYA